MNNEIDAPGTLPPRVVAAGGLGALNPPHSSGPEGMSSLSAAVGRSGIGMSVGVQLAPGGVTPAGGLLGRRQRPRAAPWSDATIAQIGAWVAEERSQAWMADALGITRTGFKLRCDRLGITIINNVFQEMQARGVAVLRQHYATHPDTNEVLRMFCDAVGRQVCLRRLGIIANDHGLHRDKAFSATRAAAAQATMVSNAAARRVEQAKEVQAIMNNGVAAQTAGRQLGIGRQTILRMRADGLLVTVPVPVKPLGNRTMTDAKKQARYRARVAAAPPKPKPVPVMYVAPPPPPPAPLPPPSPNGRIYAEFRVIRQWAENVGIEYDGSNMDRVNKWREAASLPLLVQEG